MDLAFFDDILVSSKITEEHNIHLQTIHQLFVNKKKCTFRQERIEYLGHVISGQGVAADPRKLKIMIIWPVPKDIKALRGFLGLTGNSRSYVKDYGKIANPLSC